LENDLFHIKKLKFNWKFGLILILLFSIPRFFFVLKANQTGNYNFTSIIFIIMWLTPFILLTKKGRKTIGIAKPKNFINLIYAFILGVLVCSILFVLGRFLYHDSIENWFVYISNSFKSIPQNELQGVNRTYYFLMFTAIGITFSPIGEELLYRGIIHQSFVKSLGNNKASILDSLAFALVHIAHFGIIFSNDSWIFPIIPSLIWVLFMFLTSRMFFYCKTISHSIYGAIISHAGFNFAMTYFIFYHIL
jgi:membrane protease YdiL (CAAX protease family)